MDAIWKATFDGYMSPIYSANPQGAILESIKDFEREFAEIADQNEGNMDIFGVLTSTGLQERYTKLYMAVINGGAQGASSQGASPGAGASQAQPIKLPTVREFLDGYRMAYDSVKSYGRAATNAAYEELLAVENRTDDLIEAQIIIEKEKLVLNTIIADYKAIADDFMAAADPNYEVTTGTVKATIAAYATATDIDQITYMSELSRAVTDDIAVQILLRVEMMTIFSALIFAWERAKQKVREGGREMQGNAMSMVVTREKLRAYYTFMSEDMCVTFDVIEKTPFYRIMLLHPTGLDELWRIKKVAHPDNIEATRYVLFEEILSDRTLEDILMTPQPVPYYIQIDTNRYHGLDEEYMRIAEELNRDIPFFRRNRANGMYPRIAQDETPESKIKTASDMINNSKQMQAQMTVPDGNA